MQPRKLKTIFRKGGGGRMFQCTVQCTFPVVMTTSSLADILCLINNSFIDSICKRHFKTGYSTKKHHEKPELQFNGDFFKNCQGHLLVDKPVQTIERLRTGDLHNVAGNSQ